MRIDRRKFFAGAIAFVAALFTPKPKQPQMVTTGWAEPLAGCPPLAGQHYAYYDGGHRFHVWPDPAPTKTFFVDADGALWEFGPDAIKISTVPQFAFPKFHDHSFRLSTPRLTPEEADLALDEMNAMIDRWNREPLFPA